MKLQHLFFAFVLIFAGFGCSNIISRQPELSSTGRYVAFTVNTQDFIYSQESIDTLNRILDLHEQYNVPVDIFLNDSVLQVYEEKASELLERLKNSEIAVVSYHVRPPTPFYKNYDTIGLAEMDTEELYQTFMRYMQYEVDPETGLTTDEPGGYQLLEDLMGYAPPIVGFGSANLLLGPTLAQVYQDLGATFAIVHDGKTQLGDTRYGMLLRPEQISVKLFERLDEMPEQYISQALEEYKGDSPVFLTIKMHDNDFFATDSAWVSIYVKDHSPPFDLSLGETNRSRLSESEQEKIWTAYEAAVIFASEHQDDFKLINGFDLLRFVDEEDEPVVPIVPDVPLYVSLVTHIEEASLRQPDYLKKEDLFWEMREALINLATMLKEEGVGYNFQSDWTFLKATLVYDTGTESTNGKNIIQYLHEDLGVSIDPHAHESQYNYADVAYLIEQLGVTPSGVVGGYFAYPVEDSKMERLWEPVQGWVYPSTEWTAEVLWGGGTAFHMADEEVDASGIWRPAAADKFHIHDDEAPLPNIGAYEGTWEGVNILLEKLDAGELKDDAIYTATVMIRPENILEGGYTQELRDIINSYDSRIEDAEMAFLRLLDVLKAWETHYDSLPNILRVEATPQNRFKNRP